MALSCDSSFSATIARLEAKEKRLKEENTALKDSIRDLESLKSTAEASISQERSTWDVEGIKFCKEIDKLKSRAGQLRLLIRQLLDSLIRAYQILSRIQPDLLHSIKDTARKTDCAL